LKLMLAPPTSAHSATLSSVSYARQDSTPKLQEPQLP
jgi:hypothetical protein